MNTPDKAAVTAYYDEHGFCHTIEVRLNAPGLAREDLAEAIRSVFLPAAVPSGTRMPEQSGHPSAGYRHTELGGTAVLHMQQNPNGATSMQRPPSTNTAVVNGIRPVKN